MQAGLAELEEIFAAQHAAASELDPDVVLREPRHDLLDSELFLVGQALGRDTQRLSGLPYVFPGGPPHRLSKGGAVLDRWLDPLGYTIDPDDDRRQYAYHADLHPGFPGRKDRGSGDMRPTPEQVRAGAAWLKREIEIVEPRAIICLGKEPSLELLERYAGVRFRSLAETTGRRWTARIGGLSVPLLTAYHPSGAFQFPRQSEEAWAFVAEQGEAILSRSWAPRPARTGLDAAWLSQRTRSSCAASQSCSSTDPVL